MLRFVIVTVLLHSHSVAMADANDLIKRSAKAMQQAMEYVPEPASYSDSEADEALQQSQQALSDLNVKKPVIPLVPKLDLFNLPAQPAVDIADLAAQGQALMGNVDDQTSRYDTQVLIFVSSSMPQQTIRRYVQQTQQIGGAIVLRGFINDSLQQTQVYLANLLGEKQANKQGDKNPTILIDPTLFSRFDIQQVPTTVITESEIKPCVPSGCPTPVYHTVGGDVPLSWSLALVARQTDSESLKASLRPLIKDMERLR